MAQPFIGEIRIFAGTFNPVGWAFCDGQLMPISENEALFNIIGTTYGGDGQETFALPNLQGRLPIHNGTNPGTGTNYQIGETGGVESVTLSANQIPTHTHPFLVSTDAGLQIAPAGGVLGTQAAVTLFRPIQANQAFAPSISTVGGSQPHDNFQPYLCMNYIISLFGLFPPPP